MKIFSRWEVQTPEWIRSFFPGTFWRGNDKDKTVYLTFDDGPVPEITGWVCRELKKRNIKATFFCVGKNAAKYPEIHALLKQEGHVTGSHTYDHLPAWKSSGKEFFKNVDKGAEAAGGDLFRPPHGQLYPWQTGKLKKRFRKIIMWDVLSKDYDNSLTAEEVFENVKRNVRPGSVIVFHDSVKARPRLEKALPRTLDHLLDEGYKFGVL